MARRRELAAIRAARARKKRRNRRRKRAIILALEIIILIGLLSTAYVMAKYDKVQKVEIDPEDIEINEGVNLSGYMTVALFGGDSREGELEAGTHADTIIIAAIDNDSKEIRLASIYRDTLLQQADGTLKKANNAYFCGGPQEAINMLNKNLDLDITDYATVDFKAMSDVVDLLGGVEIEVTDAEAEMMNQYIGETAEASDKEAHELESGGTYTLDGPQAVTYARLRKLEGGDYKRTERQRTVIEKLFEKIKGTDIATLNKIIDTVFPQVSTSFSLKKILTLVPGFTNYKLVDNTGFPMDKTDGIKFPGAGDVVVPLGLAENVCDLHLFLYPKEEFTEVSDTVQEISNEITYQTGVVRPAELDADKAQEAGETGVSPEDAGSQDTVTEDEMTDSGTTENQTAETDVY